MWPQAEMVRRPPHASTRLGRWPPVSPSPYAPSGRSPPQIQPRSGAPGHPCAGAASWIWGSQRHRAQRGPPEASWPRPSTRGLYTVALTCPLAPGTHRGFASANKSDSGAADSWTGPPPHPRPCGPWPSPGALVQTLTPWSAPFSAEKANFSLSRWVCEPPSWWGQRDVFLLPPRWWPWGPLGKS